MNIEDRMSLWAAKRPREEPAELMLEGAQEIADLRRAREEDGNQMSALIDGYQKMQAMCVDGKYLTDEERESLTRAVTEMCRVAREYGIEADANRARALRGLLERLSPPAT